MPSFGWRPDLPDQRDYRFALMPGAQRILPEAARIDPKTEPPVGDQGELGSCTAWMGGYLHEQLRRSLGLAPIDPSELFLYWWTRYLEGGTAQTRVDSGATIRDTVKALARYGLASEASWPYVIPKYRTKPPARATAEAARRQALTYQRATRLDDIKGSIVDGFPIGMGWVVYDSALTNDVAKTGHVPMPMMSDSVMGGHASAIVGYDDRTRLFEFRNSWGRGWGRNGHGTFPYEYIGNPQLSMDWWAVRSVEA